MAERPLFVVIDWSLHFETYESLRLVKACTWVAMPNKHDGKSYRRLTREKDGPALFGAWCLLVQVASKCPVRGTLADLDGPLSAEDLEDKTGMPARPFARLLELASEERIGWLRKVTERDEIATLLEPVRAAKCGRARKSPARSSGSPADNSHSTDIPAHTDERPQIPADFDQSPQLAGPPADSRRFPHNSAPHARARADRTLPDSTRPHTTEPPVGACDALSETVSFLTDLFGKKRTRLSQDAEHELSRFTADLPLHAGQRAILEWFYRFPKNSEDFMLRRRCGSADALAKNLFAQIELAEGYAEQSGADIGTEKKPAAPEPHGWQDWMRGQYPMAPIPATWREVPESVRSEFELKGAA